MTLWAASAGAPTQLGQAKTDADGRFALSVDKPAGANASLYLVATGGTPAAGKAGGGVPALDLLAVLGGEPPAKVVVNELTTVASAFTTARFISGDAISGNTLGLRIAAGNVPNLVNPRPAAWGKALLDPLNSTQTTTLANFNTLGTLITAFATVASDDWRARFLKAATPTGGAIPANTLEAMAGIAREPWAEPKALFALFDEAYPQPKDGGRRAAPFVPYLAWARPISRSLCVSRAAASTPPAGSCSTRTATSGAGRTGCPARSPASQEHRRGRRQVRPQRHPALAADHRIHGHGDRRRRLGHRRDARQGLGRELQRQNPRDGPRGPPVGNESDFPFKEKLTGLMGIGVAANGDVWVADGTGNQLLHFPAAA